MARAMVMTRVDTAFEACEIAKIISIPLLPFFLRKAVFMPTHLPSPFLDAIVCVEKIYLLVA